MTCHETANVITLSSRCAVEGQATRVQALQVTAGQLDQLASRLRQCSPEPGWSAHHWMIASTPFRMRLVGARKRMAELVRMSPVDGKAAIRWVIDLNEARLTAEQKLRDIDSCLRILHDADTSVNERAQNAEIFLFNRSGLLKALDEIQRLVSSQLQEQTGGSRKRSTNRRSTAQLLSTTERNTR